MVMPAKMWATVAFLMLAEFLPPLPPTGSAVRVKGAVRPEALSGVAADWEAAGWVPIGAVEGALPAKRRSTLAKRARRASFC